MLSIEGVRRHHSHEWDGALGGLRPLDRTNAGAADRVDVLIAHVHIEGHCNGITSGHLGHDPEFVV